MQKALKAYEVIIPNTCSNSIINSQKDNY